MGIETTIVPDDFGSGGKGLDPRQRHNLRDILRYLISGKFGPVTKARFATTANINLTTTALTAIDGVTPAENDIALVKDQSTGSQNGLYVVHAVGGWLRLKDSAGSDVLSPGMLVEVSEGTANGDKLFTLQTNAPIAVDTTSLTFAASVGTSATASNNVPLTTSGTGVAGTGTAFSRDDHRHPLVASAGISDVLAALIVGSIELTITPESANNVIVDGVVKDAKGNVMVDGTHLLLAVTDAAMAGISAVDALVVGGSGVQLAVLTAAAVVEVYATNGTFRVTLTKAGAATRKLIACSSGPCQPSGTLTWT